MNGAELIFKERKQQIEIEGWTPKHDDKHIYGELAQAAQAYCHVGICQAVHGVYGYRFYEMYTQFFPDKLVLRMVEAVSRSDSQPS
jgi:hypothetical protein